jgi:hypothetical protein
MLHHFAGHGTPVEPLPIRLLRHRDFSLLFVALGTSTDWEEEHR